MNRFSIHQNDWNDLLDACIWCIPCYLVFRSHFHTSLVGFFRKRKSSESHRMVIPMIERNSIVWHIRFQIPSLSRRTHNQKYCHTTSKQKTHILHSRQQWRERDNSSENAQWRKDAVLSQQSSFPVWCFAYVNEIARAWLNVVKTEVAVRFVDAVAASEVINLTRVPFI